jgi:hypothetical protein
METATPSDLPFAAADTASGERWISLRELVEATVARLGSSDNVVRRADRSLSAAVDGVRRP